MSADVISVAMKMVRLLGLSVSNLDCEQEAAQDSECVQLTIDFDYWNCNASIGAATKPCDDGEP
jgi:hypothetical protein